MEPIFNSAGISDKDTCPICDSPAYTIKKKKFDITRASSWVNESTMEILGLESVESRMRFCVSCFHFFRSPLFDESLLYGETEKNLRKKAYEKYFPGKIYGGGERHYQEDWFIKSKEIFLYISRIFSHNLRRFPNLQPKEELKILDWGGGSGYLGEVISLISQKVLKVPCQSYCYDYHERAAGSFSPYFKYVTYEALKELAPFDIIFLSHILEHAAFPNELLKKCSQFLSKEGILVLALPYEQPSVILPKNTSMHYHQQLFSLTGISESLTRAGYKNINVKLYDLSYKGNKMFNLLASASPEGNSSNIKPVNYLMDIYNFQKNLFIEGYRKYLK